MQPGTFKQEVMRINNAINQELFGVGLLWQKVELSDDRVLIIAKNRRVRALTALDGRDGLTTRLIDIALLEEYKRRFLEALKRRFPLPFRALLKDYDPVEELAFSLLLLGGPAEELIRKCPESPTDG
ncbi:DUF2294 domain-containing protein [Aminithiophilus ramosus]|uniref:DUF2294 domain-containing protein n=2 Tax=Synergistales TaxID=649776 RepID=A0A9Q7AQ68_9BACT|nr:hypothetical protein [Aminithiophilus ramosus]QTX32106.1 DUF2294 domain-containing protein [Aminithiophilus ramosus]QVL35974.1 DUF2294 domain-containing protein [Synergistota bacterium]